MIRQIKPEIPMRKRIARRMQVKQIKRPQIPDLPEIPVRLAINQADLLPDLPRPQVLPPDRPEVARSLRQPSLFILIAIAFQFMGQSQSQLKYVLDAGMQ